MEACEETGIGFSLRVFAEQHRRGLTIAESLCRGLFKKSAPFWSKFRIARSG